MKKTVRILSLLLALSILLTVSAVAAPALDPVTWLVPTRPSMTFSDVKTSDWFYKNMDTLVRAGGINGYENGTFRPNAGLTLAEFIKTLVAIMYPGQTSYWADYQIGGKTRWYSEYVGAAAEAGLLENVDYGYSALEAPVSRYIMAVVMVNAATAMGYTVPDDYNVSYIIYDYNAIPAVYKPYVRKAYYVGLLTGKDAKGSFEGAAGLTRAEACTAIVRLFDATQRATFAYYYADFDIYALGVKTPRSWYSKVTRVDAVDDEDGGYLMNFFCDAAVSDDYDGWLATIVFYSGPGRLDSADSRFRYIGSESGLAMYYFDYAGKHLNPNDSAAVAQYNQLKADINSGQISIVVKYR